MGALGPLAVRSNLSSNPLWFVGLAALVTTACDPGAGGLTASLSGGSWDASPIVNVEFEEDVAGFSSPYVPSVIDVAQVGSVVQIVGVAPPPGFDGPFEVWVDLVVQNPEVEPVSVVVAVDLSCDFDGDGAVALACQGRDCDDADPNRAPTAIEACNGIDDDCDGRVDDRIDYDSDRFGECQDCDDSDATVNPDAPELCDGLDNDCDGVVGTAELDESDADGDGAPHCADCDDDHPQTYPGAFELCDGVDNDCDPTTTSGAGSETDADGDGVLACNDCDDGNPQRYPGNAEACDGVDNDCGGTANFGGLPEVDQDLDGHWSCTDCDDVSSSTFPEATELCDGLDNDCDGSVVGESDDDADGVLACADCSDSDATSFPGAAELCDGEDNDCDGQLPADELDADGDGFLACADCDDSDAANFPGGIETCDGQDNDCDGLANADVAGEVDLDGDGSPSCADCDDLDPFNAPGVAEVCDGADNDCDGVANADPAGESDGDGDGWLSCDDCDDAAVLINPGAVELCDGVDNDCSGSPDFDAAGEVDGDSDGFLSCEECDDTQASTWPGASELCDAADNDCDGSVDEAFLQVPTGYSSIQSALDAALTGDSVCVAPGTYYETVEMVSGVVLESSGGAAVTTIDAAGSGQTMWVRFTAAGTELRGFTLTGGVGTNVRLSYLTPRGGGLHVADSEIALTDLIITGNSDDYAFFHVTSSGELSDIVVTQNASSAFDFRSPTAPVSATRLAVSDHSNAFPSVISISGDFSCESCVFENNDSPGSALLDASWGALALTNTTIKGNDITPNPVGGPRWLVKVSEIPLTLQNVQFAGNVSDGRLLFLLATGGPASFVLDHCTFVANAGAAAASPDLWVSGNLNATVQISNSTFSGAGPLIYLQQDAQSTTSPTVTATNSNFYAGSPPVFGGITSQLTPLLGTGGNQSQDPLLLDLTGVDPADWDLHLAPTSPLVDAGSGADPDGSPSDVGSYGGPWADVWDLDGDGYPEWWQPGPYDPVTMPGAGWDCDDRELGVGPDNGC